MTRRKRAFTLIEVALVAALAGILIGMLLPSLERVTTLSRRTAMLAEMRQHASIIHAYMGDHHGWFPYLADPNATDTVLRCGGRAYLVNRYFFAATAAWSFALGDAYYGGRCQWRHFSGPGLGPGFLMEGYAPFRYSSALVSRPEFWRPETREGPRQWRAVRESEILFPSYKAVICHPTAWLFHGHGRVPMVMHDGAAHDARPEQVAPFYPSGEGEYEGSSMRYGVPGMHTIGGAHGRDLLHLD